MPAKEDTISKFNDWKEKAGFATKDDLEFFRAEKAKIDKSDKAMASSIKEQWSQVKAMSLKTGAGLTGMTPQEIKLLDANAKRTATAHNKSGDAAAALLGMVAQKGDDENAITAKVNSKEHAGAAKVHKNKRDKAEDVDKAMKLINSTLKRELWDVTGSRELTDRMLKSFLKNAGDNGYEYASWKLGFDLQNRSGGRHWNKRVVENFGLRESADGGPATISMMNFRLKHAIKEIHEDCDEFTAEQYWDEIDRNPQLANEKMMSSVDLENYESLQEVQEENAKAMATVKRALAHSGRHMKKIALAGSTSLTMAERQELQQILGGMADLDDFLRMEAQNVKADDVREMADNLLNRAKDKQKEIAMNNKRTREMQQTNTRDRQYGG